MNLPNKLTLSRIIAIPFFVGALHVESLTASPLGSAIGRWVGLLLFVAAAITDYYDGVLARRGNLVTNFGKLFDPLADKLLTMSAFVMLVEIRGPGGQPVFPAWAIILILAREFVVTGMRSAAGLQGRVVQADRWGKHKTAWQLGGIIGVLTALSVRASLIAAGASTTALDRFLPGFFTVIWVAVVAWTVGSGLTFMRQNWFVLRDDV